MVRLFADDTGLHMHGKDINSLIQNAKTNWRKLFDWCFHNKLTVNFDKTCFVIFHTVSKPLPQDLKEIDVNGIVIKRVDST